MLRKVQWSGFPIIANLFRDKLLHCEGASSRGGCRTQRASGGARRAQLVMVAAFPRAWLQAASTHMQRPLCHLTEGRRKDWVLLSPCSSVLALATQIARGSWAGPSYRNIRFALGLGPARGFCENGVLPAHLRHLNLQQCWGQHPGTQEVSVWASTVTRAWLYPATETNEKVWPWAAVGFSWHAAVQGAPCGAHLSYLVHWHSAASLALSSAWVPNRCTPGTAQLCIFFPATSMAPVRTHRRICISFSRACFVQASTYAVHVLAM